MDPRRVEPLSRVEFEQLSIDQQNEHVQSALVALREAIPHTGADAGAFIDLRLYVQELVEWAPTKVERLWPLQSAGLESNAEKIHAAFEEALDSGSLNPEQAQFATTCLQAAQRLDDLYYQHI